MRRILGALLGLVLLTTACGDEQVMNVYLPKKGEGTDTVVVKVDTVRTTGADSLPIVHIYPKASATVVKGSTEQFRCSVDGGDLVRYKDRQCRMYSKNVPVATIDRDSGKAVYTAVGTTEMCALWSVKPEMTDCTTRTVK